MMLRCVVVVGMLIGSGCIESSVRQCGDLTCSEVAVCSPAGDRCVLQTQIDACEGAGDGVGCSVSGVPEGVCAAGVCLGAGCGNGIVDPQSEEQCDDGNRISLDGCRGDCLSDERCGDGVTDLVLGELCDCGDGSEDVPGCTMANADVAGASCRTDCKAARCGDDVLDPAETCDDGNVVAGDGCRSDCTGRWTKMPTGTFTDLSDVWGTGPTDVFAVGSRKILHYDGVAWTQMATPQPAVFYRSILGFAANDVYAIGERVDHYDGVSWTTVATPAIANYFIAGMWGFTPTNLWLAFTSGGSGGYFSHNTGSGWSTPALYGEILQITGRPSEAIAIAYQAGNPNFLVHCALGSETWSIWTAPVVGGDAIPAEIVYVASANTVFAFGTYQNLPRMFRYDGSTWTMTDASEIAYARGLGGVATDYLAVGSTGRVSTSSDGITWTASPTDTTLALSAVWGYAPNRAFIVGENGAIFY